MSMRRFLFFTFALLVILSPGGLYGLEDYQSRYQTYIELLETSPLSPPLKEYFAHRSCYIDLKVLSTNRPGNFLPHLQAFLEGWQKEGSEAVLAQVLQLDTSHLGSFQTSWPEHLQVDEDKLMPLLTKAAQDISLLAASSYTTDPVWDTLLSQGLTLPELSAAARGEYYLLEYMNHFEGIPAEKESIFSSPDYRLLKKYSERARVLQALEFSHQAIIKVLQSWESLSPEDLPPANRLVQWYEEMAFHQFDKEGFQGFLMDFTPFQERSISEQTLGYDIVEITSELGLNETKEKKFLHTRITAGSLSWLLKIHYIYQDNKDNLQSTFKPIFWKYQHTFQDQAAEIFHQAIKNYLQGFRHAHWEYFANLPDDFVEMNRVSALTQEQIIGLLLHRIKAPSFGFPYRDERNEWFYRSNKFDRQWNNIEFSEYEDPVLKNPEGRTLFVDSIYNEILPDLVSAFGLEDTLLFVDRTFPQWAYLYEDRFLFEDYQNILNTLISEFINPVLLVRGRHDGRSANELIREFHSLLTRTYPLDRPQLPDDAAVTAYFENYTLAAHVSWLEKHGAGAVDQEAKVQEQLASEKLSNAWERLKASMEQMSFLAEGDRKAFWNHYESAVQEPRLDAVLAYFHLQKELGLDSQGMLDLAFDPSSIRLYENSRDDKISDWNLLILKTYQRVLELYRLAGRKTPVLRQLVQAELLQTDTSQMAQVIGLWNKDESWGAMAEENGPPGETLDDKTEVLTELYRLIFDHVQSSIGQGRMPMLDRLGSFIEITSRHFSKRETLTMAFSLAHSPNLELLNLGEEEALLSFLEATGEKALFADMVDLFYGGGRRFLNWYTDSGIFSAYSSYFNLESCIAQTRSIASAEGAVLYVWFDNDLYYWMDRRGFNGLLGRELFVKLAQDLPIEGNNFWSTLHSFQKLSRWKDLPPEARFWAAMRLAETEYTSDFGSAMNELLGQYKESGELADNWKELIHIGLLEAPGLSFYQYLSRHFDLGQTNLAWPAKPRDLYHHYSLYLLDQIFPSLVNKESL
jgi:hypothetical protein